MLLRCQLRVLLRGAGGFVCCFGLCAGIRGLTSWRGRFGFLGFALASALRCLLFTRRPCAGRHLLFFAAAKKSRQKKAAHTANTSSCLRAPNRSLTSRGNFSIQVRCQRSCGAPHPLHAPAFQHALPDSPPPPRANCVSAQVLHTPHFGPIAHASHPVRAPSYATRQPTHSLPPGRHIPFAAACPSTGIRGG